MPTLNQLLHEARWQRHWQLLLLAFAATSAYFAFVPVTPRVAVSIHDKLNHLAAFGAMGLAAALARPSTWRHTLAAAAGLIAYGAFIELVQSLLPTRSADAADLLADALGVATGLLLVAALRRVWRQPSAA
jgi:VanZ family protein